VSLKTSPYWPDSLLKLALKLAAVRAKITKRVGWHTFRHYAESRAMPNGVYAAWEKHYEH